MDSHSFVEAVKHGDREAVEQMIARDPSLAQSRTESGVSAVLLATYYGQRAVAELLIEQGIELDIFEAAATGRLEQVSQLLDHDPSLANAYAVDGFQPLGLASFFGHTEVAKMLLARGADVNSASRNGQQVRPLHSAVAAQHLDIARLLLEHGADVNARQEGGFTPLFAAAQNGQVDMVRLLLANGAERDGLLPGGQTALSAALERGYTEVAALLRV